MNYGLYAIVLSIPATGYIKKAIYLKKRNEIALATTYTATLLFSIVHIHNLITTSSIL